MQHLQALYASKIVSYAQGFMLMREAAKEFGWNLNYGGIALMWRGGCIIRRYKFLIASILCNSAYLHYIQYCSRFLGNIKEAFEKNHDLENLLLDDFFKNAIHECQVFNFIVLCAGYSLL